MRFEGSKLAWWLSCVSLATLSAAAIGSDPPSARDGEALYQQNCAACHEDPDPAKSRAPIKGFIALSV